MCRKHRAAGWCLLTAGIGVLLGLLLGASVLGVLLALGLIGCGIWLCCGK